MPNPDDIQERVTNYPQKARACFCCQNMWEKLIGLKRKFHSDQLVNVKRSITGDIVPSAKTEVGMCDGAQHSDENGSIQKVKRTRTTDVTPDCDSAQESAKKRNHY